MPRLGLILDTGCVCFVVFSWRTRGYAMYVPYSHERVVRRDGVGLYMVVAVDFFHQNVSLVPIEGDRPRLVRNVPFSELEPVDRVSSSSARWKVRTIK
jgi:hypothetical protein